MDSNNNQHTTFWNFLKKRKIEIPIIQRDYAQGRIGKEKLREKFLTDIKRELDASLQNKEASLKLDFVYGSVENNRLNPLDGQQRLTTLWLLHWYFGFKAGMLEDNKEIFKNFTYETRTTSREFCNKLSDFDIKDRKGNVVELIQNQTWFFSAWKQDPTIQAMLNMLGGTPIKDDKENEIIDGIEEVFCDVLNFEEYWEKLTSNDCPIVFYYLDLLDLTLSDDLYIKMNARGKPLSNFENFKADLVGYIEEKGFERDVKKPEETIAHKLDTKWTNIFWKNRSEEYKIDKVYYAFINRFLLNFLITEKKEKKEFLFTADKLEKNNILFKYLYGKSGNDVNIQYDGFEIYKFERDETNKKLFEKFEKVLDNFHSAFKDNENIDSIFFPSWNKKSDFRFIPEYIEVNDKNKKEYIPTILTQTQRVIFHAICCYFEEDTYKENSFKQWMRVVWNIVENANIETIPTMIGAIRLIDDLGEYSHKIYEHLKIREVSKDFAKEQMEEEKEKANQILNGSLDGWEGKIVEAEKAAFFKGAIRFLFRTNNNEYDWKKFDERLEKAQKYFNKEGVKGEYCEDAILLRSLVSYFNEWHQFWDIVYENSESSWKTILTKIKWIKPTSNLLDNNLPDLLKWASPLNDELPKQVHCDFVLSALLSQIQDGCKLNYRYDKHALYPPRANANWKKYVIGNHRNEILSKLVDDEIIECNQKIDKVPFLWGWKISFTLKDNGKKFQWWDCLKEQNETEEWEKVKDVTLDNLEQYLRKLA